MADYASNDGDWAGSYCAARNVSRTIEIIDGQIVCSCHSEHHFDAVNGTGHEQNVPVEYNHEFWHLNNAGNWERLWRDAPEPNFNVANNAEYDHGQLYSDQGVNYVRESQHFLVSGDQYELRTYTALKCKGENLEHHSDLAISYTQ